MRMSMGENMARSEREIQVHMVKRIPLRELPFLISFGIYMFFGILTQTMYYQYFSGSLYRMILGGCVLILAFQELIYSRDWLRLPVREIGGGLFCLLAAAYTWKIADGNMLQRSVAFLFLYMFCARNVDYLHIAEDARIVSWIALILLAFIGIKMIREGNCPYSRSRNIYDLQENIDGNLYETHKNGIISSGSLR